jgi:hypothetical protein
MKGFNPNFAFSYSSKDLPDFRDTNDNHYQETVRIKPEFKEPEHVPTFTEALKMRSTDNQFTTIATNPHQLASTFKEIISTIISSEIRHPSHDTQYVGWHEHFTTACYICLAQ